MTTTRFGERTKATDARVIATAIQQMPVLALDQGVADTVAVQLASSDVDHGCTDVAATETYGTFLKVEGAAGGLLVNGLKDADGVAGGAVAIRGHLDENVDTTKTTAGRAIVEVVARQISGTSIDNLVADGNAFSVRAQRGGSGVTVMIVDEDGDVYHDGVTAAYDAEDDISLIREVCDTLARPRGAVSALGAGRAEVLGILHPDENGVMMSTKRHNALLRGAVLQLSERVQKLEAALTKLLQEDNND